MFIRTLLVLVVATSLFCAGAFAEGAKEVVAEIAAARKAKDDAATSVAVKKVVDAYRAAEEDKAAKGALLGVLGKVLKDKKVPQARMAAVDVLVEIGESKSCWKQLARFLPNAKKTETATDFQLAVIRAAGKLAAPSAIKPLTELAHKCKDNRVSAAAARALGGYGKDEKNRVKVLVELITIGLRTRPGHSTTKQVSKEAQDRWIEVGAGVLEGLNTITGVEKTTFEEWEEVYKENKKKPAALFK